MIKMDPVESQEFLQVKKGGRGPSDAGLVSLACPLLALKMEEEA